MPDYPSLDELTEQEIRASIGHWVSVKDKLYVLAGCRRGDSDSIPEVFLLDPESHMTIPTKALHVITIQDDLTPAWTPNGQPYSTKET